MKRVVEVKRELRLVVEANVEREEDDDVRVEFEKRASVWLLKSDGVRATRPVSGWGGNRHWGDMTYLTKS